jgi:hypothetical protein
LWSRCGFPLVPPFAVFHLFPFAGYSDVISTRELDLP